MHRYARIIGTVVLAIGLAVTASFTYYAVAGYGDFQKAQMFRQRNPGNAMYDLQFFVAASQLMFIAGGAVGGALLSLNGLSWLAIDSASRAARRDARP